MNFFTWGLLGLAFMVPTYNYSMEKGPQQTTDSFDMADDDLFDAIGVFDVNGKRDLRTRAEMTAVLDAGDQNHRAKIERRDYLRNTNQTGTPSNNSTSTTNEQIKRHKTMLLESLSQPRQEPPTSKGSQRGNKVPRTRALHQTSSPSRSIWGSNPMLSILCIGGLAGATCGAFSYWMLNKNSQSIWSLPLISTWRAGAARLRV